MGLDQTYSAVVRLARSAPTATDGLEALGRHLAKARELRRLLHGVDVDRDVASVRSQLKRLIKAEPPPSRMSGIYFGLFDTVDRKGSEGIGYYVAGAFRRHGEWGTSEDGPWWPKRRYLRSAVLDAVKHAELVAAKAGRERAREVIAYAGQLGAAIVVSRFASEGLFGRTRRLVGFDSGD